MISVETNLPLVREKFSGMAVSIGPTLQIEMGTSATLFGERMTQVVKAHTPVSRIGSRPGGGPHLVETTETDHKPATRTGVTIITRQTKAIPIRGKMVPLYAVLTSGHQAPPQGIRPVNARALFWPGLGHPVAFSRGGSAAPNEYGADARREIAADAGPYFSNVGKFIVEKVVKANL